VRRLDNDGFRAAQALRWPPGSNGRDRPSAVVRRVAAGQSRGRSPDATKKEPRRHTTAALSAFLS
jgi:hypothetical protein